MFGPKQPKLFGFQCCVMTLKRSMPPEDAGPEDWERIWCYLLFDHEPQNGDIVGDNEYGFIVRRSFRSVFGKPGYRLVLYLDRIGYPEDRDYYEPR